MKIYNLQGYGEVKIYPMPDIMKLFAIAFVWNKKIRCSALQPSQRLVRHEMTHVLQQQEIEKELVEKLGERWGKKLAFLKFLWIYVKLWFTTGLSYYRHPMEKDAREYQSIENFAKDRRVKNWEKYL